jgi:hypothetical protein
MPWIIVLAVLPFAEFVGLPWWGLDNALLAMVFFVLLGAPHAPDPYVSSSETGARMKGRHA